MSNTSPSEHSAAHQAQQTSDTSSQIPVTIVHLVRHGEVFNPGKILYGRIPGYHLSSRGHSMAARTAKSFEGHDVAYLAASPLLRAQQTAQPISQVTGLDVEECPQVIESGNDFEGLRTKGWRSQLWNPKRWPQMYNPLEPSWGRCTICEIKPKATSVWWYLTNCRLSWCNARCAVRRWRMLRGIESALWRR